MDHACRRPPYEVLRREPLVWVSSLHHVPWTAEPLSVALFQSGCAARLNVVEALSEAGRAYRSAYSTAPA